MTRPFAADRAAATIATVRRTLVTGSGTLAPETAVRACDLAEAIGAAVDFDHVETAQVAGPTIARVGAVTADPEELRDRADLVVFWFCDPAVDAAGFLQAFVTPATETGRPRHTIAVGAVEVATSAAADRHLQVAETDAVDLARLVHAARVGLAIRLPPALVAAREALAAALESAGCVAFVTHHRDPIGLEPWSLVGLVRAISHRTPAFEVPLVVTGAPAAVSTWRYGAAGGIARADRAGAAFRPAECDARRLITRGEVDCVVAVGDLPAAIEDAIATRGDAVAVIRIDDDPNASLDTLLTAVRAATSTGART